jgi:hypothetical protein
MMIVKAVLKPSLNLEKNRFFFETTAMKEKSSGGNGRKGGRVHG